MSALNKIAFKSIKYFKFLVGQTISELGGGNNKINFKYLNKFRNG
jgi:hypothetical protein